jgi:hypothetical protein
MLALQIQKCRISKLTYKHLKKNFILNLKMIKTYELEKVNKKFFYYLFS